ncbi:MAG: SH3 domain-containing protein [Pseudodesulfovibrio sp.]
MIRSLHKILILACCFLVLAATTAMAFGEIRYPDRPLNLRKARTPKSAWVGSLYPGQKVKIGFLKDGWVAVFEPGETRNRESAAVGFANVKYLKPKATRVEPTAWGELVYTPRKLNVRTKPSRKGTKVDMLNAYQHVRIDFPEDDWSMVFSPKATIRSKLNAIGYSSGKYFKPATKQSLARENPAPAAVVAATPSGQGEVSGSVAQPPAPVPAATTKLATGTGSWGKVVTIQRKINLRQGRTTGSKYMRTLKPGEKVRVDFLKNGWYAVFFANEPVRNENRAVGYALQSLLESEEKAAPVAVSTSTSQPIPVVVPVKKATSPAPQPKAQPKAQASAASMGGTKKTMVIDKSKFEKAKRPDPTPNKSVHGYQYRLLEKAETKKFGETWITLKVFLATTQLPGSKALRDFTTTLWKENKHANRKLAVLVYLPGMDTEDLAYAVVQFDDAEMLELWVRKVTLFGTDFL